MTLRFHLFTGGDSTTVAVRWRAACSLAGITERISVADQPGLLADAVTSASLFGGPRVVAADLDGISDDEIERIADAAASSDATVIARIEEITPTRRKRFESFGTVEVFTVPQAKELPGRVDGLADSSGIRLSPDARRLLVERSGDDLDRVRSVVEQCRIGGITEPTTRQLLVLLGSTERDALPWDVSDALDRHDLPAALDAALRCEPIPLVAYLSNRYLDAARVREREPHPDADTAVEVTGQSRWQAERTARLAGRLDSDAFATRLRRLAEADRHLKSDRDPQGVVTALVRDLI